MTDCFFDTIQFLLPLINRIISAGRDHIDTVPPGYMIFLIFVRVIRHQSMIFHYFSSSLLIQRAHAARPATCFTSPVATSVWNSFTETLIFLPDPMILLQIFRIRSQKDGSSYPVSSFYNSTPFVSITCLYQNAESFMRNEFYIMFNN